jgi:type I restriction enzyme R subunit
LFAAATLKQIATELVGIVRRDAKTDWAVKEQVRAQLRRSIKRLLRKYKYPPDQQENAVLLVLQQAEVIADEWVAA